MIMVKEYSAHETAVIDEGCKIGKGTKIWHFSHIMNGSEIGENCNIGQNVVVSPGVKLGRNVKVQNNVSIYSGVICDDMYFSDPQWYLQISSIPQWDYPEGLLSGNHCGKRCDNRSKFHHHMRYHYREICFCRGGCSCYKRCKTICPGDGQSGTTNRLDERVWL